MMLGSPGAGVNLPDMNCCDGVLYRYVPRGLVCVRLQRAGRRVCCTILVCYGQPPLDVPADGELLLAFRNLTGTPFTPDCYEVGPDQAVLTCSFPARRSSSDLARLVSAWAEATTRTAPPWQPRCWACGSGTAMVAIQAGTVAELCSECQAAGLLADGRPPAPTAWYRWSSPLAAHLRGVATVERSLLLLIPALLGIFCAWHWDWLWSTPYVRKVTKAVALASPLLMLGWLQWRRDLQTALQRSVPSYRTPVGPDLRPLLPADVRVVEWSLLAEPLRLVYRPGLGRVARLGVPRLGIDPVAPDEVHFEVVSGGLRGAVLAQLLRWWARPANLMPATVQRHRQAWQQQLDGLAREPRPVTLRDLLPEADAAFLATQETAFQALLVRNRRAWLRAQGSQAGPAGT
ncbi:MAG TPA: hypothetical protein VGO93_21155 [Candidatus Xenobia bacterium]